MHIFAGVSADYPVNYLPVVSRWSTSPHSLVRCGFSTWNHERSCFEALRWHFWRDPCRIGLGVEIPCENCPNYPTSIVSIFLLAAAFCAPAIVLEIQRRRAVLTSNGLARKAPGIITAATMAVAIVLLFEPLLHRELSVVSHERVFRRRRGSRVRRLPQPWLRQLGAF